MSNVRSGQFVILQKFESGTSPYTRSSLREFCLVRLELMKACLYHFNRN
jgi:hypothetical protein